MERGPQEHNSHLALQLTFATFTLFYGLESHKAINMTKLLELHDTLIKMLQLTIADRFTYDSILILQKSVPNGLSNTAFA
jgi:hypothetical protein